MTEAATIIWVAERLARCETFRWMIVGIEPTWWRTLKHALVPTLGLLCITIALGQVPSWAQREHAELRREVQELAREIRDHTRAGHMETQQRLAAVETLSITHHQDLGRVQGVGIGLMAVLGIVAVLIGFFGKKMYGEIHEIRQNQTEWMQQWKRAQTPPTMRRT